MSLKSAEKSPSLTQNKSSKKSYLLAFAFSAGSLLTGLGATGLTVAPVASQAAGLGDLFSSDKSATQPKFLPVNEAFQVSSSSKPTNNGTRLSINFDITPEHYVYKDQIKLTLPAGVSAAPFTFSQKPVSIDDPTFGQVLVFDQANMVATTILSSSNGKAINNAAVTIGWQGCAKAGLCYPPEKIKTTVNIAAASQSAANSSSSTATVSASNNSNVETAQASTDGTVTNSLATEQTTPDDEVIDYALLDDEALDAELGAINTISGADEEVVGDNVTSEAANNDAVINNAAATNNTVVGDNTIDSDPFGLASHPWLALVLLFLAGLVLALTPCVLPMLPIVANIVAREDNPTVKRGVILTTSYAIGVAIAYGILGAVIAVFGESLGIIGWLQNPIILIGFAIVFVLLALYMLGVFSIRLPRFISSKMQGLSQAGDSKLGSTGGSLIAGFLSALVVSPCVSAPLFGALLAVSTIGSPLLGFAALFMLGFGLSAPLILIGATQGKIMPKAGEWMNWVKQGFALLLFAVALLLIERVFISPVMLMVWALWFMVVAMWAWSWLGKGRMLTQALGLIAGIWATCLIVGAALGNDDSLHPLASLTAVPVLQTTAGQPATSNATDKTVTTLAELDTIVAANPKVLVFITAEWCIACRIMDKNLFHNRPAQMQDWQLVKLDITETTADSKAILARYKLFGPPALLYYQDGQLVNQQVGEIGRAAFEQTLTALN
ncbi:MULTISPECIES: protein-disulfide reductase DsbD domain-containing protein [unclassified Psychrobacter]|jgi:thiol:disulfide interchange protein DsbD|nr:MULTISPECIES: protein-disulfide reductase DsbD domain-containing protein [unclassified Psychrobacter]MBA6243063.1 sulfite exporter TauE/SafE family protein [Psychrobacter sp. Urea-trap-18]MBA6284793.1 sulfite exporter TauE/SafE family protein [Psychrobacter sp. Urea-trap-16]MBA6317019.1 sulfite exporter TauE/SafE family protein [Psychrobacter sp. Urea-trap-20]MBA6333416.1 sulfite exporter TauE/SafE family protein [Psychrobacter sp. Urea-trap-19]PKG61677.1 cytochrome C biogenesis protein [Ps